MAKLEYKFTIHCSYTPNGMRCPMDEVRKLHTADKKEKIYWNGQLVNGFGWLGVGYHFGIQPDGQVEKGLELRDRGRHVAGANLRNIGCYLAGDNLFTEMQFISLKELIKKVKQKVSLKPWDIYCHNNFPSAWKQQKPCPNMSINHIMYWLVTGDWSAIDKYILKVPGDIPIL